MTTITIWDDPESDYVEFHVGKATPAHMEEVEPDIFERHDEKTEQVRGCGIFSIRKRANVPGIVGKPVERQIDLGGELCNYDGRRDVFHVRLSESRPSKTVTLMNGISVELSGGALTGIWIERMSRMLTRNERRQLLLAEEIPA